MPARVKPQTPLAIENAKPKAKPYKLTDGLGMFMLVMPNGSKLWRFTYYRPGTGKRNALSLGAYPDVSLRDARALRTEFRELVAFGTDPAAKRKAEHREASRRHAEAHARFQFSFAIATDDTLTLTVRGNTLHLTRHQTDAIRSALLATQG